MFKKNFALIFLAKIFLSFANQTKTMQETDLTSISIEVLDEHIDSLIHLQEHKYLKITDENLNIYRKLLLKFLSYIDIQEVNLKDILLVFDVNFKITSVNYDCYSKYIINCITTLEDINAVLDLLLSSKEYIDCSYQEVEHLNRIFDLIMDLWDFSGPKELFKLLTKNRLLPPLDHFIDLKFGGSSNFFIYLVNIAIDINLFKSIINEEKNKDYNWEKLFNMRTRSGCTILHYAAKTSKNILKVILELTIEKNILNDFINKKTYNGVTPLMVAADSINEEIVKLLIDHGANPNILSKGGKTALDYARNLKKELEEDKYNNNHEKLKRVDQCIELLTQQKNCILQ